MEAVLARLIVRIVLLQIIAKLPELPTHGQMYYSKQKSAWPNKWTKRLS